jgi:hypothetical protein
LRRGNFFQRVPTLAFALAGIAGGRRAAAPKPRAAFLAGQLFAGVCWTGKSK